MVHAIANIFQAKIVKFPNATKIKCFLINAEMAPDNPNTNAIVPTTPMANLHINIWYGTTIPYLMELIE